MTKTAIPTVRWIGSIDPSWNWNLLGAVFLVFLTVIAPAQTVVVDTLHATQPWGQRTAYTFPSIRVVGEDAISERINRTLMIDFLGEDLHVAKDPLSALWGEDTGNGMARIPLLEWSGVRTSAGVFTVQFTGEFCGAYCEDFDQHFLFDVRTGMRLDPVGLFKTEDEAAVNAMIDQRWRKIIEHHVGSLEAAGDATIEAKRTIDLYRSCLDERPVGKPYIEDLLLEPDGLQFIFARCSSHVDRELDDLGAVAVYVFLYEILDQLRPEAKDAFDW
ncbi:MAG: hypothetical protein IPO56_12340 [Flavobacteriales bacterium]|nr:hypothetical protein [Flavobacteriales bacterium]